MAKTRRSRREGGQLVSCARSRALHLRARDKWLDLQGMSIHLPVLMSFHRPKLFGISPGSPAPQALSLSCFAFAREDGGRLRGVDVGFGATSSTGTFTSVVW